MSTFDPPHFYGTLIPRPVTTRYITFPLYSTPRFNPAGSACPSCSFLVYSLFTFVWTLGPGPMGNPAEAAFFRHSGTPLRGWGTENVLCGGGRRAYNQIFCCGGLEVTVRSVRALSFFGNCLRPPGLVGSTCLFNRRRFCISPYTLLPSSYAYLITGPSGPS